MHLPFRVGISPTLNIRGIIATEDMPKGIIIERCPVILFSHGQAKLLMQTLLKNYYFEWTKEYIAIVLGYGSLINHSYKPNTEYFNNYKAGEIVYRTYKPVRKNEELFVNYNGEPASTEPVGEDLNFDMSAYRPSR